MKRKTGSFPIKDFTVFKQQILNWLNRFNICSFLDNHQYPSRYHSVECIAAAGAVNSFIRTNENPLQQLRDFCNEYNDWLFGHVNYDFKNYIEPFPSSLQDSICFPDVFFFRPEVVIQLSKKSVEISSLNNTPEEVFTGILLQKQKPPASHHQPPINIQAKISKKDYQHTIHQLKQHILRGDCYEINFCQEFYAENAVIDTLSVYHHLTQLSPVPFACYYKLNDKYLLCASPERYLKKTGTQIISQPVKGTLKRNILDEKKDEALKQQLYLSNKDRSENVMIVDLVRNDLSKICKEGTVQVEELFGVYTYPQVHQMISTISGKLNEDTDFAAILKATFPMGSMTGAPKRKVMELIEQYEQTKRGIYSGCVGYIAPDKDFDFNVVIRSIMYNAANRYLSYQVGGGITFNSNAESEYEECMLKAAAMKKALQPE